MTDDLPLAHLPDYMPHAESDPHPYCAPEPETPRSGE
jgi:hypothetical protein